MGYSTNPVTIRKMIGELGGLLHGRPEVWQRGADAPKFAYKLRECLAIAQLHPNEFPGLAKAARELTIKMDGGTVMAMPRKVRMEGIMNGQPFEANLTHRDLRRAPTEPEEWPDQAPNILFVPETVAQAIQFWLNAQPTMEPVEFRNATFTNAELQQLTKWAANLEPAWAVTHEPGSTTLVLQLDSPDLQNKL